MGVPVGIVSPRAEKKKKRAGKRTCVAPSKEAAAAKVAQAAAPDMMETRCHCQGKPDWQLGDRLQSSSKSNGGLMRPGCSDSECGRAKIRRLLLTLSSLSAVRHNLLSLETLEDPHRSFSLEPG